jgi:hypothetical protein
MYPCFYGISFLTFIEFGQRFVYLISKMTKSGKIIKSINSLSEIERLDLLAELMKLYRVRNPMEFIQNHVCNELQISGASLKTKSRKQNVVLARQFNYVSRPKDHQPYSGNNRPSFWWARAFYRAFCL